MRDVYRAASEGFRIFGGATEFGATGRRPPTMPIGNIILSGSTIRAYRSFAARPESRTPVYSKCAFRCLSSAASLTRASSI